MIDADFNNSYFNSQPHEEADKTFFIFCFPLLNFNSQPHEEADWRRFLKNIDIGYFNSQPHEEADDNFITAVGQFESFQLAASRGG